MIELIKSAINIPLARAQIVAANEVADQTQDQLTQLVGTILSKIPLWITALIVIILSFIIARIVKSSVENKLVTEGFEEEHKELSIVAGRSANAIVLTIGLTVGLKIAGIDLTTIIAAGAFGIGFALKDLIMNFIAGVMLLTARHFTIGDIIKVNGILGKIEEIQSRATVVKNFDGTKVVIPNAELFVNPVTSYTSNPFRRVEVIVGVEYGTELKLAMDSCMKAVKESRNILAEPKPSVGLFEYGESSINLKVKGWVESKKGVIKTRSSMIQNIKKEFDAVGIGIPFPIRTIVFDEDAQRNKKEKMADEQKVEKLLEEEPATETSPGRNPALAEQPTSEIPVILPASTQQQPIADTSVAEVPADATTSAETTPSTGTMPASETTSPAETTPLAETTSPAEITTPPATPAPAWLQQAASEQPTTPSAPEQPAVPGTSEQPSTQTAQNPQ